VTGGSRVPKRENEPALYLVVTLVVRRAKLAEFREFERNAQRIMARYGGSIREAVLIDTEADSSTVKEVHVVTFPDRAAFDAYRADAEHAALRPMRELAVVSTEVEFGMAPAHFP
jgi:hypothetical protein